MSDIIKKNSSNTEKLREYYENILAIMPGHVYLKDINGVWMACNNIQANDLGFSSWKDCIGKTDYDLFTKEEANLLRKNDLQVINSKKSLLIEEPQYIENGETQIYLSQKVPLLDDDQIIIGILGISFNITEIKKREAQLQQEKIRAEVTLENVIANMPEHVFWKDKNGVLLGCNDLQAKRVGLSSRKEVVGKTAYDMVAKDLPEKERRAQADAINTTDFEIMSTGIPQSVEEPFALPNGDELIFLSKKAPLYDAEHNVIGLLGISFDITAEKEAEKLRLEKSTLEEREATTKLIAASMAHELRTPLSSIEMGMEAMGNIFPQLLETYKMAKESGMNVPFITPMHLKAFTNIVKNTKTEARAALSVIDMLLVTTNTSHIDVSKFKELSIAQCVNDTLARYPLQDDEVNIIHWQQSDFVFRGDDILMTHVFFNLLKNALYYIRAANKGEILIWCEQNEKFNILHFKDTGLGMDKEVLEHIFERFFTRTRHGSGVGLAFCKLVMQSFGGDITCESVKGEYTDFTLNFPKIK